MLQNIKSHTNLPIS
jgi:hypothetical protein